MSSRFSPLFFCWISSGLLPVACGGEAANGDKELTAGTGNHPSTAGGDGGDGGVNTTGLAGSVTDTEPVGGGGQGTAGDDAGQAAAGEAAIDQTIGAIGEACSAPGTLSCHGHAQTISTICNEDNVWVKNVACASDQTCSTAEGRMRGTCQPVHVACTDRSPGETYCDGLSVMQCGPDLLTSESLETCNVRCTNGMCAASAGDPCPVVGEGTTFINCSEECGEMSPKCASLECGGTGLLLDDDPSEPVLNAIIRTPGTSGLGCSDCDTEQFAFPLTATGLLKITVPPPWRIHQYASTPCNETPGKACALGGFSRDAWIATDDPNAPPRNIVVQRLVESDRCE